MPIRRELGNGNLEARPGCMLSSCTGDDIAYCRGYPVACEPGAVCSYKDRRDRNGTDLLKRSQYIKEPDDAL